MAGDTVLKKSEGWRGITSASLPIRQQYSMQDLFAHQFDVLDILAL